MERSLLITTVIFLLLICAMEYSLWRLFCRGVRPISFPPDTDESMLRFFSVFRMRTVILTHTIVLLGLMFFFFSFLW